MVLDDVFERFARAEPRHRHGPGRPGERPRPPGHRPPLRGRRPAAVHPHPAVLLGRGPDGHRRLPHPARRSTPPTRPTPRPSASRSRPSTTSSTASSRASRPHWSGTPPAPSAPVITAMGGGRPAWLPGYSHQDPRRQPPGRDRAPAQGAAHHRGRGPARPRPGRARPAGDAGHRRVPLRGRPRPGAVAAGPGPGDGPARRGLDRRPQLLHDRLPLRDRPRGAVLRDPPARRPPSTSSWSGERRPCGRIETGAVFEQTIRLGDGDGEVAVGAADHRESWTSRPGTARPRSTS